MDLQKLCLKRTPLDSSTLTHSFLVFLWSFTCTRNAAWIPVCLLVQREREKCRVDLFSGRTSPKALQLYFAVEWRVVFARASLVFTRVCAPATHSVDTRYAAICSTSNALLFSAVQGGKKEQNKKRTSGEGKTPGGFSQRKSRPFEDCDEDNSCWPFALAHSLLPKKKNAPLGRKKSQLNRRKEKRSVGVLQPLSVCFAYRILYKKPTVSSLETFSVSSSIFRYLLEGIPLGALATAPVQTPPGAARMECLSRNRSRLAPY